MAPQEETSAVPAPENRFSEDDLDTEIEVDENGEKKPRKKKNIEEESLERSRKLEKAESERGIEAPPPYQENPVEKKKKSMELKISSLSKEPIYFAAGIFVCVLLPFGIYVCDVIISINVINMDSYKAAIITPENNFTEIPTPFQLVGRRYSVRQSVLHTVQFNSKNAQEGNARKRISRDVSEADEPEIVDRIINTTTTSTYDTTEESSQSPSNVVTTSPTVTLTDNVTPTTISTNSTFSNSTESSNSTSKTKNPKKYNNRGKFVPERELLALKPTPPKRPVVEHVNETLYRRQDGEFCLGLVDFYNRHMSYYNETGSDWFRDMTDAVYRKEQTLFFMFTIIGFIFLLIGLGLRCDVFLSDEWSSFILINLVFYSISMAITVAIFAEESGEGGLRCVSCRFTSYCPDINPWNYATHWPADSSVQWTMVVMVSFVLKCIDCVAIGIVTLKFIVDMTQAWWVTGLKVFGWLFVFPMMIFTPMLGVTRYMALPAVSPYDVISSLVTEVFFYVGVIFWAVFVIILPFFCKTRMCSGSEEEERQEEEEMYA